MYTSTLMVIGNTLFNIADCIEDKDWDSALSHAVSAEDLIRELRKHLEQKVKEVKE
jgi:hypothetical protein